MVSASKTKTNQVKHDGLQSFQCIKSSPKSLNTSESYELPQPESYDGIYLDYSKEILDPENTPLQPYPKKSNIKVLLILEDQRQVLLECTSVQYGTVQNIITRLRNVLKNKNIHILLVTDPVHHVRYVIKVLSNPSIDEQTNDDSGDQIQKNYEHFSSQPIMYGANKLSQSFDGSCTNGSESGSVNSTQESPTRLKRSLQILTIYPPPPCKGSITITMDDLKCLDDNQYLNDIIIDFYLKYLVLEKLLPNDQQRVHLFSSYFYTRLTNPRRMSICGSHSSALLENADHQHENVKRWTKDVNIFEKDFVIIPIVENEHWFLAIICYPNMIGVNSTSESTNQNKCPRILIFESMSAFRFTRSVVGQTLKKYVQSEYKAKFGKDCPLSANDLEATFPYVPRQENTTDCGLYLLQYAESFLKDYVTGQHELTFSLIHMGNWFDEDVIQGKREELKKLIVKLASNTSVFKKPRLQD